MENPYCSCWLTQVVAYGRNPCGESLLQLQALTRWCWAGGQFVGFWGALLTVLLVASIWDHVLQVTTHTQQLWTAFMDCPHDKWPHSPRM